MPREDDEKVCVLKERVNNSVNVELICPQDITCSFLVQFCMDIVQRFCLAGSPSIAQRAGTSKTRAPKATCTVLHGDRILISAHKKISFSNAVLCGVVHLNVLYCDA